MVIVFTELNLPKATELACPWIDEYNDHKTIERKHSLNDSCATNTVIRNAPKHYDYYKWLSLRWQYLKWFFYIRSNETVPCPFCEKRLKVIGSRKRGVIEYSGEKRILVIRRLKCLGCGRIHHELPDIIIPYKRYGSETVECIVSLTDENDYPCELSTAKRLKIWFYLLRKYFNNTLISLTFLYDYDKELCKEIGSLITRLNSSTGVTGWLKKLVRYLVNSGRWLHTRSA